MVTGMCVQQFKSIFLTDDICLDVYFVLKVTVFAISHNSCTALLGVRGRMGEQDLMTLIKPERLFIFTTAVGIC